GYRRPQTRHQILIIMNIAPAYEHGAQYFAGLHQMVQIGAAVVAGGRTGAFLIKRARIVRMAGILQIDPAAPGKGKSVAAVAGRHHAIEHVDTAPDRLNEIVGRADTNQIARTAPGKEGPGRIEHTQHFGLSLADRTTANRIAVETDVNEARRRFGAQVR